MTHAQKPDFVFRAKRTSPFKSARWGRQFSRLLAAEVCASAVVMLDTPCSEIVWRVLATHSIRQFPLHFPCRTSPCANTFQLESISCKGWEFSAVLQGCKHSSTYSMAVKQVSYPDGKISIPDYSRNSDAVYSIPCSDRLGSNKTHVDGIS
jgi:hypothetical protein